MVTRLVRKRTVSSMGYPPKPPPQGIIPRSGPWAHTAPAASSSSSTTLALPVNVSRALVVTETLRFSQCEWEAYNSARVLDRRAVCTRTPVQSTPTAWPPTALALVQSDRQCRTDPAATRSLQSVAIAAPAGPPPPPAPRQLPADFPPPPPNPPPLTLQHPHPKGPPPCLDSCTPSGCMCRWTCHTSACAMANPAYRTCGCKCR